MGNFDDIGKLKQLPLDDIESEEQYSESEFIINAAAETVIQTGGRNWIPIIVKEAGEKYQVVSNHFIYAVAHQAKLNLVWCIVIEPDSKIIEQVKILAREKTPKVNLNTASRDTILSALRYLVAEPGSALKGVDPLIAANRISSANRESWSNFNPIITLKCRITRGKKLNALNKVFFLEPPPPPPAPPPAPKAVSIKLASRNEIFERISYLSTYKIGGFESLNLEQVVDAIFTASKGKWKSLNSISKLECGIDASQIKTLKTVFTL